MPEQEYITAGEFGRFRLDFQAAQGRLEQGMRDGFGGLGAKLDALNGKTHTNSEGLIALGMRVGSLETRVGEAADGIQAVDAISTDVVRRLERIDKDGCGAVAICLEGAATRPSDGPRLPAAKSFWTSQRKHAAVGAGAGAVGLALIELVTKFLERFWPIVKP